MGAIIDPDESCYRLERGPLHGPSIFFFYPDTAATENLLMAACLADGETVIRHASAEPEVVDLANFLVSLGARIEGAGTSTVIVEGVDRLHGADHTVMPDRLIAGTFAAAGLITRGDVTIEGIIPEHLDPVIFKLDKIGARVEVNDDRLCCAWQGDLRSVDIQAIHYPGFPTDLQAVFGTLLTQADGTSTIHERVFENRLGYAQQLNAMGADIEVSAQTAVIRGPTPLHGAEVNALDIRSGAAMILAGLAAHGETVIRDAQHVDRGYEDFVDVLQHLGGHIERM